VGRRVGSRSSGYASRAQSAKTAQDESRRRVNEGCSVTSRRRGHLIATDGWYCMCTSFARWPCKGKEKGGWVSRCLPGRGRGQGPRQRKSFHGVKETKGSGWGVSQTGEGRAPSQRTEFHGSQGEEKGRVFQTGEGQGHRNATSCQGVKEKRKGVSSRRGRAGPRPTNEFAGAPSAL